MMKALLFLPLFLLACADGTDSEEVDVPTVSTSTINPYRPAANPEPDHIKECVAVRIIHIRDCTLYDLMCDDGQPDLAFVCPITYWDHGPYVPLPVINNYESK